MVLMYFEDEDLSPIEASVPPSGTLFSPISWQGLGFRFSV